MGLHAVFWVDADYDQAINDGRARLGSSLNARLVGHLESWIRGETRDNRWQWAGLIGDGKS